MLEAKNWISFFAGGFVLALGIIPLLNQLKVISFGLPASMIGLVISIAHWLVALGGLYLLYDSFLDWHEDLGRIAFFVALFMIGIGIVPILNQFNVIGFSIPFLSNMVYYILFIIEGLFLMVVGMQMD
ncbi:hypothetical protein K9M79_03240 [Candidatus Woesearchaeota archaeon]|nr:hypothetical protein [Candidatus Woesearchaeota archaeon]